MWWSDHSCDHSPPMVKTTGYNLRPRLHNFELPWKDTRNFMLRQLNCDIYCAKTIHQYCRLGHKDAWLRREQKEEWVDSDNGWGSRGVHE